MARYEYKTVTLRQKGFGVFRSREVPDLEHALNRYGRDGWRFRETILPSALFGESDTVILLFEREH